ncbi:MAG: hypothetical protein M3N93_06390 [Acidobacteriota bacterium]|nr:hypothetical protein [Acidobacteriota bacterium]
MFKHPKFDIDIQRGVDAGKLGWPTKDETGPDSGFGCNRAYDDLTGRSWADAQTVFELERDLMSGIESEYESLDEESRETELLEAEMYLDGLDLGVAATVIALSAAGCVPFSSCNAGAFGGDHQERYPLVAFYAPSNAVDLLLSAAAEAEIGLDGGDYLIAYADDIRKLSAFAWALIKKGRV